MEEQVGGLGLKWDVAHLIDDDHRDASQRAELVLEAAGGVGGTEPVDPLGGGGEGDAVAGQAGTDAQGDGEVGLAGAGRTEEDDVGAGVDEVELKMLREGVQPDDLAPDTLRACLGVLPEPDQPLMLTDEALSLLDAVPA